MHACTISLKRVTVKIVLTMHTEEKKKTILVFTITLCKSFWQSLNKVEVKTTSNMKKVDQWVRNCFLKSAVIIEKQFWEQLSRNFVFFWLKFMIPYNDSLNTLKYYLFFSHTFKSLSLFLYKYTICHSILFKINIWNEYIDTCEHVCTRLSVYLLLFSH